MLGLFTGVLTVAVAYDDVPGVAVLKAEADACATSAKQATNGMMQMLSAAPTEHGALRPPGTSHPWPHTSRTRRSSTASHSP